MLLIESERAGGRLWRPLVGKARLQFGSILGRVGAGDQGHVCSAQAPLMVSPLPHQLSHRHVRRGRLGRAQHRLRRESVLPGFSTSDNFFLHSSPSQLGRAAKAAGSALNQGVQNVAENLEGALVTFGEGQAERAGYALLLMLLSFLSCSKPLTLTTSIPCMSYELTGVSLEQVALTALSVKEVPSVLIQGKNG